MTKSESVLMRIFWDAVLACELLVALSCMWCFEGYLEIIDRITGKSDIEN